jgi:hypothetical protein
MSRLYDLLTQVSGTSSQFDPPNHLVQSFPKTEVDRDFRGKNARQIRDQLLEELDVDGYRNVVAAATVWDPGPDPSPDPDPQD